MKLFDYDKVRKPSGKFLRVGVFEFHSTVADEEDARRRSDFRKNEK